MRGLQDSSNQAQRREARQERPRRLRRSTSVPLRSDSANDDQGEGSPRPFRRRRSRWVPVASGRSAASTFRQCRGRRKAALPQAAALAFVSSCLTCYLYVREAGKGTPCPCRLRCLTVVPLQLEALLGVLKHCCLCRCAADIHYTLPVQCCRWLHFHCMSWLENGTCLKRWRALRFRQLQGSYSEVLLLLSG